MSWRRASHRAFVLLGLAIAIAAAPARPGEASDAPLPLDELGWIHPDRAPIESLHRVPTECVAAARDVETRRSIELGRLAFRSPRLLGGLAARRGMSCDSCHRNGHDHPDFFIEGVSGKPGTADVTGGIFSRGRDDGIFNPVQIPSLLDVAKKETFGTQRPHRALRDFLRSVVVEEFQGILPSERVERGLLAYLGALQSAMCPDERVVSMRLDRELRDVSSGFRLLEWAFREGDSRTSDFVLVSLRAILGRIDDRFPESGAIHRSLVDISRALESMRSSAEQGLEGRMRKGVRLRDDFGVVERGLRERVHRSYYDLDFAQRALSSVGD